MPKKSKKTDSAEPNLGDLEHARKEHVRELKRLEKMTDRQFEAFKRNFELGKMDPTITRREAIDILRSMICTNLSIQQEKRTDRTVEKDEGECYPPNDDSRE